MPPKKRSAPRRARVSERLGRQRRGYEPLEFGKDHLGQVRISGAIANAGSVSTTFLFTLPSGYRPAYTKFLPVVVADSGGTSGLGELWVFSNGNVELLTYIGSIQYARFSDKIFTLN
ncbi:MAG: hypothetical protein JXD23_10400 [Spirochaetales bacterium]|nr:hypothetical protein [Spirochaetales bacterium]